MHVMYTCRQLAALTIKPNEEPALLKLHHDPLHNRLVIPLVCGNKMYDRVWVSTKSALRNVTRSKSDARARTRHHNVERVQVLDRFVLPIRQLQQRP